MDLSALADQSILDCKGIQFLEIIGWLYFTAYQFL